MFVRKSKPRLYTLVLCLITIMVIVYKNSAVKKQSLTNIQPMDILKNMCELTSVKVMNVTYIKPVKLPAPFRETGRIPYRNILDSSHPPYLPNYRNPCWREEINITQIQNTDNFLALRGFMSRQVKKNIRIFQKRLNDGIPWRLRCLPYFYIGGFIKSGTTEFFHNIREHPMVPKKNQKEVHWWSRYRNSLSEEEKESSPIHDYVEAYNQAALDVEACSHTDPRWQDGFHPKIIGDGSTRTLTQQWSWWMHPENKDRSFMDGPRFMNAHYIKHITPKARIIISMRNPAERLYSYFLMKRGRSEHRFHRGVVRAIRLMSECLRSRSFWSCVTDPTLEIKKKHNQIVLSESIYYPHLVKWLEVFPRNQLYFVKLEEFSQNRVAGLNRLYKFLGLEEIAETTLIEVPRNRKVGCPYCSTKPMLNETRLLLDDFFKPFNMMTAKLLNDSKWNFS